MNKPYLDPQGAFLKNMTDQLERQHGSKSDELYWFIKSELSKGKPFPSHQAMQDFAGVNYPQAILDLVLRKLVIRELSTKHGRKTKYTYRIADDDVPR